MLPTTIVRLTLTGVVLLLPAANTAAAPVTYTVTKTADTDDGSCDADCSLREAITAANANSGQDTIAFNIPTGDAGFNGKWWRIKLDFIDPITLVNDLPPLTDGVTINGFTAQNTNTGTVGWKNTPGVLPDSDNPCYPLQFEKPEIAIDGEGASNGLTIDGSASNVTIQGLAIYDTTANAIEAGGGTGTSRLVTGMFIGVRPDGSNPGGERNQGFGVRQLDGGTLEVSWSYVGHNGLGGMDGEASTSVLIAKQNEVFKGGWNSGSHDGIDHNGKDGLAQCNLSRDNTNNTGVAEGDSGAGFEKGSSSENSFDLDNNLIEYNTAFRNRSSGISIRKGQRGEFIRKNVVWDNWVGISVNDEGRFPTNRHALSRNSIFKNRGLGIDLQRLVTAGVEWRQGDPGPDGINPNDPCDPDGNVGLTTDGDPGNIRSNDLQNYPDLTFAKRRKTKTQIQGTLDSTPNTTFLIEFFSTPAADLGSSADREGKFFLAETTVTTNSTCTATINGWIPAGVPDNHRITATARIKQSDGVNPGDATTQPWSTSEFSNSIKPPQEDDDDFDSDGKRDDVDSDDDNDGKHDDVDSDDDNDGKKDDEDSDDDSDGIKDGNDSKSHREKQESDTGRVSNGQQQASLAPSNPVPLGVAAILLILLLRKRAPLSPPRSIQMLVLAIAVASAMILTGGSASSQDNQEHTYQMVADSKSLVLIAYAERPLLDVPIPDPDAILGDPLELVEQPLVVSIYDPFGNLVATSPPTPGPAIAATVPFFQGIYTVTIRNVGSMAHTYDLFRVIRENWLLL